MLIHCCVIVTPVSANPALPFTRPAADNAVILMYHNIADDTPPSTSVSPLIFEKHMQFLKDNGYTVWPLYKTLMFLASGKTVPEKTVVLTFDDAYQSVYREAFPLLKANNWPFTVFVTTQYMSEGYSNFMSWQQLREIQDFGGEIGNHSFSHPHMIRKQRNETEQQWRSRIFYEIDHAQKTLQQHVINPVRAVAYPYGEYSKALKDVLFQQGYFGLGQHSGAVSQTSDFQAIPRFPMTTGYDSLDDFAIKVATKNLPLRILSPVDGVLTKEVDTPVLSLQLGNGDYKKDALACYASGQGCAQIEWTDRELSVLNVRARQSINPGRTRYNCTAPSKTETGVYYWFSFLWMKPQADGSWYSE